MNRAAHFENRQQQRNDHEADQRADDHDQNRRQQRNQRFYFGAHVPFFHLGNFQKHFVQLAALLADINHLHHRFGKNAELAQRRGQRIAAARFLGHLRDLRRQDAVADGVFHNFQRG